MPLIAQLAAAVQGVKRRAQAFGGRLRQSGLPPLGPAVRPRLALLLLLMALLIVVASVIRARPDSATPPPLAAGELELRALDVGQGDALLTRLDDATMLVDAGPDARTAGAAIVPHLRRLPSEIICEHLYLSTQPVEEPPRAADFQRLLEQFGPLADHLLLASDYPHWDSDNLDVVLPHSLPEELKARIRYHNASALYRL